MVENWGLDVARSIFATIDKAIYGMISIVYEILIKIAEVTIFEQAAIVDFATRIYSLLGLIMFFKVTFSFINYIVNPDQINDKAKGAHKIILNIVVSLSLVIITPFAFKQLYALQTGILKDNLIPQFILGTSGDIGSSREYYMSEECKNLGYGIAAAKTDGDYISLLVMRPFFQIEPSKVNSTSEDLATYCKIGTSGTMYGRPTLYFTGDIYNDAPGGTSELYTFDYKFFVSTAVGVVVLLILISFCMDIAVRTIKLGFLQIIAPIPIISYIDPNSSKNGMFKKWLKDVGKTWTDLFIRLFAIFFAIYIIKFVTSQGELSDLSGNPFKQKFWVDLFLIIGALIFAKKLPQILSDLLGIKIEGGLKLNPMKKIRDDALGGKAITGGLKGAAALGLGAVAGSAANLAKIRSDWKKDGLEKALSGDTDIKTAAGKMRAFGTAFGVIGGGLSTGARSLYQGYKQDSFTKGLSSGLKGSVDKRGLRDKRQNAEYGTVERGMDTLRGFAGIDTSAKFKAIEISNNIASQRAAIANMQEGQKTQMGQLSVDQITALGRVSYDGNSKTYNFSDKNGKLITSLNDLEGALSSALSSNTFGAGKAGVDATVMKDAAANYIQSTIEINALNKNVAGMEKQMGLYQKEDSNKKK